KEKLGMLGVGMCDDVDQAGAVNCGYRTQPFSVANPGVLGPGPASPTTGGFLCPASQEVLGVLKDYYPTNIPLICDADAQTLTGNCTAGQTITTYNPYNAQSRQQALQLLVSDVIGNKVDILLNSIDENVDFKLLTQQLQIEPKINSFTKKDILFSGVNGVANAEGRCTKLEYTDVTLRFQETNLDYIVVDTRSPIIYQVRIVDSFQANLTKNTCVAYCLAPNASSLFIDPQLDDFCAQTACAPEGTYSDPPAPPVCGNNINETGEDCGELTLPACVAPTTCVNCVCVPNPTPPPGP
ncbi:MAG: hypothetical protein AABX02_01040, partial [archaeon]